MIKSKKRKAKVQKIKPEYQKYVKIMLAIIFSIIIFFLYYIYVNKEKFGYKQSKPTSGIGGFEKAIGGSFQPGDSDADMPGKLKWGRDF